MKHKGNVCVYARERERALYEAFRLVAGCMGVVCMERVFGVMARMSAPRFYVSEERALCVVQRLARGEDALAGMREEKRRMYGEIWRRVRRLMSGKGLDMRSAVGRVLVERAPSFYLTERSLRVTFYRMMRRWREAAAADVKNMYGYEGND